jgi:hypothetical protein
VAENDGRAVARMRALIETDPIETLEEQIHFI